MKTIDRTNDPFELCRILTELNFDGQRTLVTPDSFASPNIKLVCKILEWLLKILKLSPINNRLPPDLEIGQSGPITSQNIEHYSKRAADYVEFLIGSGRFVYRLLGAKLDLVALCRADSSCCSELLKVAVPVFEAAKLVVNEKGVNLDSFEHELKARQKCCKDVFDYATQDSSSIDKLSSRCSSLMEELQTLFRDEETTHLNERLKVIDRRFELDDIERVLSDSLEAIKQETSHLERANDELKRDILRLDEKLVAKEEEISEARRKLSDLLVKSPVYASQYEALKKRYELAYERYVSSYRNLAYLKSCIHTGTCFGAFGGGSGGGNNCANRVVVDQLDSSALDDAELDDDFCWCIDGGQSFRDWLAEHKSGVGGWGPTGAPVKGGAQRVPAGTSKKSDETAAPGGLLLVFSEDVAGSGAVRLPLTGRDTVGPARLLESLLDATGTSKPMSASLTTAGPSAPDSVDARGAEVVGVAARTGAAVGRPERLAPNELVGSRRLAETLDMADAGLELEGLLNEFAPDDSAGLPDGGAPAADSDDVGDDEEEEDDDEEDDDDEENDEEGEDDDLVG
jgi:predicted  nucleic acid-binding Zn-ribbon protein